VKFVNVRAFVAVMRDSSRGSMQLMGPSVERIRKVSAPNTHSLMLALLQSEAKRARCVHYIALCSVLVSDAFSFPARKIKMKILFMEITKEFL